MRRILLVSLQGELLCANTKKMRDLRLHSMHVSLDGEGAHFPLLPAFRLESAFVTLDNNSVHSLLNRALGVPRKPHNCGIPTLKDVNSLSAMFGFFEHTDTRLPFTDNHHDKRYGVPKLYPHKWAFAKDLDVVTASDCSVPFPTLVTTVSTNGLEAKIKTLTLVPKRGDGVVSVDEEDEGPMEAVHVIGPFMNNVASERADNDQVMVDNSSESAMSIWEDDVMIPSLSHRRAKGVDALEEKGYSSIQDILDPHTDTTGIYRDVDASVPHTAPYRMICVDPGRIELVTYVSKNVIPGDTSAVFRNVDDPGVHKGAYSSFEYQKGSKLLSHYQWEQMQRNANPDYNAWILQMNNLSLKKPGGSTAYVNACYTGLEVHETKNSDMNVVYAASVDLMHES